MEATFQPSLPGFLKKMTIIEAMELSIIGFLFWGLLELVPSDTPSSFADSIFGLAILEAFVLGSWLIYLAYIRITRGLYPRADARLRIVLAILTSTYTLWAWIILDINRWILAKLIYRGEAPVEYAWSSRSKQNRKTWEELRKIGSV